MALRRRALRSSLALLAAGVLLGAACGSDDGGEDGAAAGGSENSEPSSGGTCDGERFRISIADGTSTTVYSAVVADGAGFFEDAGLDAELMSVGSTAEILGTVLGGDADAAIITMDGMMQALREGAPARAIVGLQQGASLAIAISQEKADELGISLGDVVTADTIAEAEGLRLGVASIGGGGDLFGRLVLGAGGLAPGDGYEVTAISDVPSLVAAFGQGTVDAIALSTGSTQSALDQFGGAYLFDPFTQDLADVSEDLAEFDAMQTAVGVVHEGRIDDRGPVYQCFADAMAAATDLIHEDPEAAGEAAEDYYAESFGDDPESYATLVEGLVGLTTESTVISEESFDATTAYLELSPETAVSDVEFEDAVDNRFAEAAE